MSLRSRVLTGLTALRRPRTTAARWLGSWRRRAAERRRARPAAARTRPLDPSLVSVLLTVRQDQLPLLDDRLARLRVALVGQPSEVLVAAHLVPESAPPAHWSPPDLLGAEWASRDLLPTWEAAYTQALDTASGATTVVLDASIEVESATVRELLAARDERGGVVQAVVQGKDDVVLSAGAVRHRAQDPLESLFNGFPLEDVSAATENRIAAADQPAFVAKTIDLAPAPRTGHQATAIAAITGRVPGGATFVVTGRLNRSGRVERGVEAPHDSESVSMIRAGGEALRALESAGFTVDAAAPLTSSDGVSTVRGGRVDRRHAAAGDYPRLRWSIKTAASAGPLGDTWGDTFFADDLARELRALGQRVVIDRRHSHRRPATQHLDDVSLVIRGLQSPPTSAERIDLLWVISHPDEVTAAELTAYDRVFAASFTWSAETAEKTGVDVVPLLQATDPARFHPGASDADLASDVLFVGSTRGEYRPLVREAVEAGIDVDIYGGGWLDHVDPRLVKGAFLPNEQLSAAYRSARVVLNDHWADMAAQGFVSNRLFDAVASGARVVSDPVAGIDELFGDSIAQVASREELTAATDPAHAWPDDEARLARAAIIATEHSFASRARTLLESAVEARAGHRDGPRVSSS